jgi:hypothetical protein
MSDIHNIPHDATAATKTKTQKKNLIKEELKGFKFEYLFRKWWWRDLYCAFWDAKNRFWYGYSDRDWFNWDYEFSARNIELFKQFRDNFNSLMHKYPHSMASYYQNGYDSMTEKEQIDFFNMLIDCLEDMKDEGETVAKRLFNKDFYDCTKEEMLVVQKERQDSIDLFFETVRDRFDDFWD